MEDKTRCWRYAWYGGYGWSVTDQHTGRNSHPDRPSEKRRPLQSPHRAKPERKSSVYYISDLYFTADNHQLDGPLEMGFLLSLAEVWLHMSCAKATYSVQR